MINTITKCDEAFLFHHPTKRMGLSCCGMRLYLTLSYLLSTSSMHYYHPLIYIFSNQYSEMAAGREGGRGDGGKKIIDHERRTFGYW